MQRKNSRRRTIEDKILLIRNQLRALAPELMKELDATELALWYLGSDVFSNGDYSGYRRAIDAIEAYLRKINHPISTTTIAEELVRGGWCAIDTRAPHNVMDSIRYHLKNPPNWEVTACIWIYRRSQECSRRASGYECQLRRWWALMTIFSWPHRTAAAGLE